MSDFKRHPLSAAFPTFAQEDLAALAEDIRQFGQRESGLVLDGMVLDGWNRYRACQLAGVEFNWIEFEDDHPDVDPVAFVLSKNLHRRHLTASQRAAAVVACAQWAPNGRPGNPAPGAGFKTTTELAREADVSPRTINHAKAAHEAGLGEAVIAGEMTLKQADAQIKAARRPPTDAEAAESDGASGEVQPVKPFSLSHSDEQSSAHHSAANKESIEAILAERDEAREQAADLATELAEAKAELDAFHAAEIGEGEKQLVAANRRVLKLEAEVRRLEDRRDALMNENAELKREVKRLRRGLGMKANG